MSALVAQPHHAFMRDMDLHSNYFNIQQVSAKIAAYCEQDSTMVQEFNLEHCSTMFPTTRHPGHQNTYGMNLTHFNYPTQTQNIHGQYGQEYGQFLQDGSGGLLHQHGGVAGNTVNTSTPTWTGMYGTSPPVPIATAGSGRPGSGSSPTMDDWYTNQPMMMGINPNSPNVGTNNGYPYRPAGMPTTQGSIPITSDLSPYGQPSSQSPIPPNSMMGQSPSPTGMMVPVPQEGHGTPHGSRQNARAPYDWMKKQSFPAAPSTGKTRTKDKYRIVYSEYQKVELEKEYLYSKYITIQRKAELARSIGLSERQVKIWFQNRRAKERKQKRKREESVGNSSSEIEIKSEGANISGHSADEHIKSEDMHMGDMHMAHAQMMQVQHH